MQITSNTFDDMSFMPDSCAFGLLGPDKQYQWGKNRNPHLAWSGLPDGTKSLALINDDLDVPVKLDTFNKDGSVVAKDQQRRSLCHTAPIQQAQPRSLRLPIGVGCQRTLIALLAKSGSQ